jgi:hypothetical protein
MDNKQSGFRYIYSAKEQEELKRIREKYTQENGKGEDKMERLRRLDARVTTKAQIISLVLGVLGVLILGAGMSLVMSDFSRILGSYRDMAMLVGIAVGVVGGVIASLAYPVYGYVIKKERKKIAPEIIKLTDEMLK